MRYMLFATIILSSMSCSAAETPAGTKADSGIAADYQVYEAARQGAGSTPFIKAIGPKRFAAWKLAGASGNAGAMVLVARCLEEGAGTAQDEKEAVRWYRKAIDVGNARAMCNLGICYENGQGVDKDTTEAIRWYRKGAEVGDGMAMCYLGVRYELGTGVGKDETVAAEWYRKAADAGDAPAMSNLGLCYELGRGLGKNDTEALRWYRKAAEAGNRSAMCKLGVRYEYGTGVAKDYTEAARWYRKGADVGDETSMCNLGICYEYGRGVDKNATEAVRWFRKAANAGDARAMCKMGDCYTDGTGISKDLIEAVRWYRKGADAGNGTAMANLAICYENGQGIAKDEDEAFKWHRLGAEAGSRTAMVNLGLCYSKGRGVAKNASEAVRWYLKGAEAGHETAMSNLAACYRNGTGVGKDLAQAEAWERKLAELQGKVLENQEAPLSRMLRAIKSAKSPSKAKEPVETTRLPTIDEYLAANWKLILDEDESNDAEAHYRIGCLMEIAGPHPIYSTEAMQEASKEFLIASAGLTGKAEYHYLYYRMELLLSTAQNPKTDPQLVTLQNMLIDKDLRYYGYSSSGRLFEVNYLVLLLEENKYENLALNELKLLPPDQLATLPRYLDFPRYSGTRVEDLLLKAVAGRETEILLETKELLEQLKTSRYPLVDKYETRLINSTVQTFSDAEIKELPGGRAQAERIRARQLDQVIAKTRPALDYLRSRIELLQGIVNRAEKATTAR